MSATNPIVCTFLLKHGHCSKGKYCTFSHDSTQRQICKFYSESGNCRYGSSCSFLHTKGSTTGTTPKTTPAAAIPPPPPKVVQSVATTTTSTGPPPLPLKERGDIHSIDSMWGFEDGDNQGVYFYGAPGTTTFQPELLSLSRGGNAVEGSYSKVAASHLPETQVVNNEQQVPEFIPPSIVQPHQQICHFYSTGGCKFGNYCRHIHLNNDYESSPSPSGERFKGCEPEIDSETIKRDCGICLAPPGTKLTTHYYLLPDGLDKYVSSYSFLFISLSVVTEHGQLYGMMSHCACVFCLKCIREWRNDGIEVTHSSNQVRICPLCRIESHFVVPTIRIVFGEQKNQLIASYKQSLATKPCMYYQQDQACPFGTRYLTESIILLFDDSNKESFTTVFRC